MRNVKVAVRISHNLDIEFDTACSGDDVNTNSGADMPSEADLDNLLVIRDNFY